MHDVKWALLLVAACLIAGSGVVLSLPTPALADVCMAECGPGDEDDQYCSAPIGYGCETDDEGCTGWRWDEDEQDYVQYTERCPQPM